MKLKDMRKSERKEMYGRIAVRSFAAAFLTGLLSVWGWAAFDTSNAVQGAGAYTFGIFALTAAIFAAGATE